jgi:type II secretory pathway pseudopilin PulG
MKKNSNQQGFTLLELLLYTSLMGIIVLAVSLVFQITLASRIKNQTIGEVEQQGIQVVQRVSQTIRNSTSITSPAQNISDSQLTLVVPTGASSPTIFNISGGAVQMKEGAGAAVALTNTKVTASGLTFVNSSRASTPGSVRFQFTLTYINNSGRNEYDFTKTFYGTASLR